MKCRILALVVACALCHLAVTDLSAADPDGVTRIVVEAEDMKGVDQEHFGATAGSWRVGRAGYDHYQNNTFGGHWQSRTRTAMCDAGDTSAPITATVQVPKAGRYKLWVKYECPPNFNYAFGVTVHDANRTKELLHKTFGLIDSAKHFSFTDKLTAGSLYWTWGIDHDAAEGYEVDLPEGQIHITLDRAKNPEPAGARSVDVIMITDDLSAISSPRFSRYPLLDELRRANSVYVRFRADKANPGPVTFNWNRWGKRYNDFYAASGESMQQVRFHGPDGAMLMADDGKPLTSATGQPRDPVPAGESSVWLNIGPALNVESTATMWVTAKLPEGVEGRVGFAMDVALAPDEKQIAKSFALGEGESQLTVLLQPDLNTAEGVETSMKLIDVYRHVAAELDKTPRRGPVPQRMRFYSYTGGPVPAWHSATDTEFGAAMDFRRALGLNTVWGLQPREQFDRQKDWHAQHNLPLTHSASHHHSQDPQAFAKMVAELGTGKQLHYLSFGDEIGLPSIDINDPALADAFRDYLKQHGVTPADLGQADWSTVKPLTSLSADVAVQIGVVPEGQADATVDRTLRRLYWHSTQFRIARGVEDFVAKTKAVRELVGPHVHTSANLGGMHPFYWVHQSSFIEAFRHNAMTLAWSEDYDYTQPETMRLCVEFLAGYLKAGTKYHGQRMQFYCMPHYPGQSPEHLIQNAVMLWSQNVKDIDWFSTPPDGFTTENYVSVRGGMPTFRAMRLVNEMAGAVEDYLEPAQPVQAQVAMLLSEASDVWEIDGKGQWGVTPDSFATNAFQEERKNTYYVLRLAGYRVDLLTEQDVAEGRLKPYKALYVGGENIEDRAAAAIKAWVEAGGVLYASGGAARENQYDEPTAALDSVLGRADRRTYDRYRGALRSKIELPFLKPLDTVTLTDGSGAVPSLATRETFVAADGANVLATYADGSPAMVSAKAGSGAGYYIGTFPAQAWAKKAMPVVPAHKGGPESNFAHFVPVDYDSVAALIILRPLRDAAIRPDMRSSAAMVVAERLRSDKGHVVTLVNLGHNQQGPADDVKIEVDGIDSAAKVWSFEYRDGLKHELRDGVLTITVPRLKLVDVIVVEAR